MDDGWMDGWAGGRQVERGVRPCVARSPIQTQTSTVAQAGEGGDEVEMWAVSRLQGYDGRVSE